MKLDKIRFARLIAYIVSEFEKPMFGYQLEAIDELIDVDVPVVERNHVNAADIDELLRQIGHTDGFISAIKSYRALTGLGLKESKEAIERYRVIPKFRDSPAPVVKHDATLGDILASASKSN